MAELMKNEAYSHLSKETWEAIAVMTDNAAMLQKKDKYKTENGEEEEYNMCQALEELMEDNRNEGRRECRNEGRNEGTLEKTKIVIRNMLDRGYEIEDICAIAGCERFLCRAGKNAFYRMGARRTGQTSSGALLFENRHFSQVKSRRKHLKNTPIA